MVVTIIMMIMFVDIASNYLPRAKASGRVKRVAIRTERDIFSY